MTSLVIGAYEDIKIILPSRKVLWKRTVPANGCEHQAMRLTTYEYRNSILNCNARLIELNYERWHF